jgi:hypothetical protein
MHTINEVRKISTFFSKQAATAAEADGRKVPKKIIFFERYSSLHLQ